MGTTTRAVLRQRLQETYFGDYLSLTSSGVGTTATIVDASLANYAEGDDAFPGWWALITASGHAAIGEERRVKGSGGYASSSTTLTLAEAFGTALGNSAAYEFSKNRPTDYHNAINRAIEQLHPMLFLPIIDESLVVDNLLSNSLMETYAATVFTGWTEVGSPTTSAETTIVFHGTNSAKVVASGAAGQMTQAPTITIENVAGKTVFLKCWVYATAASTARIRLDWDGTNFENSDYHTGVDEWQKLEASAAVPETATQVKAILEVADGGTAYFDLCRMFIDPIYRYTVPSTIIGAPHFVYEQGNESEPKGPYFQIPLSGPKAGMLLRVEGKGYLSRPTTDAGTTEVDGARVDLIIARAAMNMTNILLGQTTSSDEIARLEGIRERATQDFIDLRDQPGVAMMMPPAEVPVAWGLQEDSSGRYIVFHAARRGLSN